MELPSVRTFTSTDIGRLLRLPFHTLDRWVRENWVTPTLPSPGSGIPRLWDFNGLVGLAITLEAYEERRLPPRALAPLREKLQQMPDLWSHEGAVVLLLKAGHCSLAEEPRVMLREEDRAILAFRADRYAAELRARILDLETREVIGARREAALR